MWVEKARLIGVLRWVPTPGCSVTSLAGLLEVPTLTPTTTLQLCYSHPFLTHDEAKAQGGEVSSLGHSRVAESGLEPTSLASRTHDCDPFTGLPSSAP